MLPKLRLLCLLTAAVGGSALAIGCGGDEKEPGAASEDGGDDGDGEDGDGDGSGDEGSTSTKDGGKVDGGGKLGTDAGSAPGKDAGKDASPLDMLKDSGIQLDDAGKIIPDAPAQDGMKYGDWTYYEVPGAVCRDGSPAGYYIRPGSNDVMIFMMGGGACTDTWFCGVNPYSVNQTLPSETLFGAVFDLFGQALIPQRQQPTDTGIFKKDPQNPVGDWTQVYIPYCTGDVHAGTRRDAPVPRAPGLKPQQFVGYHNVGKILDHFGKPYKGKAQKVVLTGSSAGSFGALLNFDRTQEFFGDSSKVYVIADSGIAFRDMYMEPCMQKYWRELWGLNDALPKDCKGCFNADGGGMAQGLGDFLFREKYKDRGVIGGGISTDQDQVIKLFFSAGLNECDPNFNPELQAVGDAIIGSTIYPADRYPKGLSDFLSNVSGKDRTGSYIMSGSEHQHIFRDRFFVDDKGVGTTIAAWLKDILNDKATHVGVSLPAP